MGFFSTIDISLITQSIPSLVISLVGLSLSGKLLDIEQNSDFAKVFPLLLLANCILSFKGNAELIYAMHLSSFSQLKELENKRYLRFAFDNACIVLVQSIIIGFTVGILGLARNYVANIADIYLLPRMICTCLVASFVSSLAIILMLVPATISAVKVGFNPDNIVLPVISSVGDYLDIAILVFFIRLFQYSSMPFCILSITLVLLLLPMLIYFSARGEKKIPIQSLYILILTYFLSTTSSYTIQFFSRRHLVLAASYPLFCGLTGSTAYIYLNKKITSLHNLTPHNKRKSFITLLLTSIVIAGLTTVIMPLFGINFTKVFSFLFVSGFFLSVALLMKILDIIMRFFDEDSSNAGVVALPLITSIADFIGTVVVITICIVVNGY